MAVRLVVLAAAATPGTRAMVFGDRSEPEPFTVAPLRVRRVVSGPEPACRATAHAVSEHVRVVAELAGCDLGSWTGRSLPEVGADDPEGLAAWLRDPGARPHGGETLAELVARAGAFADAEPWPDGPSLAVVTPLVARALAVHALGAPAAVVFRVDVAPLDRLQLSRHGTDWRFRALSQG